MEVDNTVIDEFNFFNLPAEIIQHIVSYLTLQGGLFKLSSSLIP